MTAPNFPTVWIAPHLLHLCDCPVFFLAGSRSLRPPVAHVFSDQVGVRQGPPEPAAGAHHAPGQQQQARCRCEGRSGTRINPSCTLVLYIKKEYGSYRQSVHDAYIHTTDFYFSLLAPCLSTAGNSSDKSQKNVVLGFGRF